MHNTNNLLKLLPPITRIRGNRLYSTAGRFLDAWLDDGRFLLGDEERKIKTVASNASDKGLLRPYPSVYANRFIKVLRLALQSVWYSDFDAIGFFETIDEAMNFSISLTGHFYIARPFLQTPNDCDIYMPHFPLARSLSPVCLVAKNSLAKDLNNFANYIVSGQQLLAAAKALHELIAISNSSYNKYHWQKFGKSLEPFFVQEGPYLYKKLDDLSYKDFFIKALNGGVLISPEQESPSIVPPDFSDAELNKLVAALK